MTQLQWVSGSIPGIGIRYRDVCADPHSRNCNPGHVLNPLPTGLQPWLDYRIIRVYCSALNAPKQTYLLVCLLYRGGSSVHLCDAFPFRRLSRVRRGPLDFCWLLECSFLSDSFYCCAGNSIASYYTLLLLTWLVTIKCCTLERGFFIVQVSEHLAFKIFIKRVKRGGVVQHFYS